MGLSSNQARFLSLTARQVDLEHRIQQTCQRSLRLASELERVADAYNTSISNRKMFLSSQTHNNLQEFSLQNLESMGIRVVSNYSNMFLGVTDLKKGVETVGAPKTAGQVAITSTEQFTNLVALMNAGDAAALSGNYILMADLDLSSVDTHGQSLVKNVFTGSLDGNGHTISGLTINDTIGGQTNLGMFSQLGGSANISNLVVKKFTINTKNSDNVGTIAGLVNSAGVMMDNIAVINTNVINPTTDAGTHRSTGGLAGRMDDGTIINSFTTGSATGQNYVGGLVGWVTGGRVDVCNTSMNINATGNYVGGLIGEVYTTGGSASIISRSYATGNVSSTGLYVGGLIGKNYRSVQDCYATGNVTGSNSVGGISGLLVTSYSSGTGAVINSYASGAVTATGGTAVGGLVGTHWNGGTIQNSFWMASTGQTNGYTHVNIGNPEGTPDLFGNMQVADEAELLAKAQAAGWSTAITYPNGGSWNTTDYPLALHTPDGFNLTYTSDQLEAGVRNGTYSLMKAANPFALDKRTIAGDEYEEINWRTTSSIFDEPYRGDDLDAENKYEQIIEDINSQDKKLELEQTVIETQYKSISSEREAVKKILDSNTQSSFKYFS